MPATAGRPIMTRAEVSRAVRHYHESRLVGQRLVLLRKLTRTTQREVALALGCSEATVYNVEIGRRRLLPAEIETVAELLGCPPAELLRTLPSNGNGNGTRKAVR